MTNEYASPEDRIRLAEFMGWKWDDTIRPRDHECYPRFACWIPPNHDPKLRKKLGYRWRRFEDLPDPLNDYADCHALIEALTRLPGVPVVTMEIGLNSDHSVAISRDGLGYPKWIEKCDDYRTGVVTLALEILND